MTGLRVDFAVIGGTGVGSRLAELPGSPIAVPTRFGLMRGRIVETQGSRVLAIARHSVGHKMPPHRVNYLAMAEGARLLGARFCIASAAVGCLRTDWSIGSLAICTDLLDFTGRNLTRFNQTVEHTDFSRPFPLADSLVTLALSLDQPVQPSATYAAMNGPRYESPAEITMLRELGADIVGMTASTEAVAMREASIPYGCITIVTNVAAGMSPVELSHHEVVDVMTHSGPRCLDLMLSAYQLVEQWPLAAES